jgi:small redox-active disulfide protein 2
MPMKIEILGPGCSKCRSLVANADAAEKKLGLEYELVKVTEIDKIIGYVVMMTPALVIDGKVQSVGKVPSEAELATMLAAALSKR